MIEMHTNLSEVKSQAQYQRKVGTFTLQNCGERCKSSDKQSKAIKFCKSYWKDATPGIRNLAKLQRERNSKNSICIHAPVESTSD